MKNSIKGVYCKLYFSLFPSLGYTTDGNEEQLTFKFSGSVITVKIVLQLEFSYELKY